MKWLFSLKQYSIHSNIFSSYISRVCIHKALAELPSSLTRYMHFTYHPPEAYILNSFHPCSLTPSHSLRLLSEHPFPLTLAILTDVHPHIFNYLMYAFFLSPFPSKVFLTMQTVNLKNFRANNFLSLKDKKLHSILYS